jgi:hypothetical protein
LPTYTTDHSFRVYYRYTAAEDLALLHFDSISENYISDSYNYVVGRISLTELHRVQEELRKRDVFIAAYPRD